MNTAKTNPDGSVTIHVEFKCPDIKGRTIDLRVCDKIDMDLSALSLSAIYQKFGIHHPQIQRWSMYWRMYGEKNCTIMLPQEIAEIDSPTVTEAYLGLRLVGGIQGSEIRGLPETK